MQLCQYRNCALLGLSKCRLARPVFPGFFVAYRDLPFSDPAADLANQIDSAPPKPAIGYACSCSYREPEVFASTTRHSIAANSTLAYSVEWKRHAACQLFDGTMKRRCSPGLLTAGTSGTLRRLTHKPYAEGGP